MIPLISIVVPVYNTEDFLEECLASIIAQTYNNLEIVVLNNGSTDNSLKIIEKYAQLDSRIKYYTIDHVDTVTESRNNAIIRATSDWVIPIDSDDYIEACYVEKLWSRHEETQSGFVGSYMVHFDNETKKELYTIPNNDFDIFTIYTGRDAVVETLGKWKFSCNGALVERKLFPCVASRGLQPIYNDEYYIREMLYVTKSVSFAPAKYMYRMSPNSTGKKKSFAKLMYGPLTHLGLIKFIADKYTTQSEAYKKEFYSTRSLLLGSNKSYLETRNILNKIEKKKYKETIFTLKKTTYFPLKNIKDFLIYLLVFYRVQLLRFL